MDKDYWYNMQQPVNGQNLQTITNDTNYLSGHPALMALGTRGALEELFLITKINGTMYGITYISSVANYPKYLNLVDVMTETFDVINKTG